MAEPKPVPLRTLQLEYRFDRLLPEKLAQAFQVLVPDKRQPIIALVSIFFLSAALSLP